MDIISRSKAKELGLTHYFTGKSCPNGHIAKRFVSTYGCAICTKGHYDKRRNEMPEKYAEASNKYYWQNRDKCVKAVIESQKRNRPRHLKNKKDYYQRNRANINAKNKEWREANGNLAYIRNREYRERNTKKVADYQKRYRIKNKNSILEKKKIWTESNRDKLRQYHKSRMANDSNYKAARSIRHTLNRTLRLLKKGKVKSTEITLGYTISEFKEHIERNMMPDMNWQNHGKLWHIDHSIPVAAFITAGVTDPKKVNALSNLMPMYADQNLAKGARFALSELPVL